MAGTRNILIDQGADFNMLLTIKLGTPAVVSDLTGDTFKAEIRRQRTADGTLVGEFSVIDIDLPNGEITLRLLSAVTAAFPVGDWFWDLEWVDSSDGDKKRRLLEGRARVIAEVTNV